jgi:hypothetical protein
MTLGFGVNGTGGNLAWAPPSIGADLASTKTIICADLHIFGSIIIGTKLRSHILE